MLEGSLSIAADRGLRGLGSGEEDGESGAGFINSVGKVIWFCEDESQNIRINLFGAGLNDFD